VEAVPGRAAVRHSGVSKPVPGAGEQLATGGGLRSFLQTNRILIQVTSNRSNRVLVETKGECRQASKNLPRSSAESQQGGKPKSNRRRTAFIQRR
jgi:hypothetical protein